MVLDLASHDLACDFITMRRQDAVPEQAAEMS
jgi:hypothetical protein